MAAAKFFPCDIIIAKFRRDPIKLNKSIFADNLKKETVFDRNFRPKELSDYVGQEPIKQALRVAISASKKKSSPLEHIVFYGPPGMGKTSLASLIANEVGSRIKIIGAQAIEKPRDIVGYLLDLQAGDILFIDEIHRLNKVAEELLYPAMEDFVLDLSIGQGRSAKIKKINLKPFTLIGATTKFSSVSSPLRSRFGHIFRLDPYRHEDIEAIILRNSTKLNISMTPDAIALIANRSRLIPRIANMLIRRVHDYAIAHTEGDLLVNETFTIDIQVVQKALDIYQIDDMGLEASDIRLLRLMIEHYNGGPVGLQTLAAALNEDSDTIEEVQEPYLLQIGFLQRTGKGRVVLEKGYKHLNIKPPRQFNTLFE